MGDLFPDLSGGAGATPFRPTIGRAILPPPAANGEDSGRRGHDANGGDGDGDAVYAQANGELALDALPALTFPQFLLFVVHYAPAAGIWGRPGVASASAAAIPPSPSPTASAASVARCGAVFSALDEDGSGVLSAAELAEVLGGFGLPLTNDEAAAMVEYAAAEHARAMGARGGGEDGRPRRSRRRQHRWGRQGRGRPVDWRTGDVAASAPHAPAGRVGVRGPRVPRV